MAKPSSFWALLGCLILVASTSLVEASVAHTSTAVSNRYQDLARCTLNEGYEISFQKKNNSYFIALIYGSKVEFRERLLRPLVVHYEKDRTHMTLDIRRPNAPDYLVKISSQYDEDANSFSEFVHYKIPPTSKDQRSFKLYEAAGDGMPVANLACRR